MGFFERMLGNLMGGRIGGHHGCYQVNPQGTGPGGGTPLRGAGVYDAASPSLSQLKLRS
ncbi:MAG: hypothetical protein ACYC3A_05550 [Halothiobacillus sp.]